MSRELPYFKFVISEWQNGDIADENYYTQGIFISLCAYYWSKDCNVSMDKVRRRFKGDTDLITELVDLNIIKEKDGNCIIEFLDEQRQSKEVQTIVNRANGAKGGRPPKTENKPNGLFFANRNESETITETKAKANRNETNIEERKEENIKVKERKEDNTHSPSVFDFRKNLILIGVSDPVVEAFLIVRKKHRAANTEIAFNGIVREIQKAGRSPDDCIRIAVENSWRGFQAEWINKISNNGTSKTAFFSTASDRLADAKSRIAESFSNKADEPDIFTNGNTGSVEHFDSFDDVTPG